MLIGVLQLSMLNTITISYSHMLLKYYVVVNRESAEDDIWLFVDAGS